MQTHIFPSSRLASQPHGKQLQSHMLHVQQSSRNSCCDGRKHYNRYTLWYTVSWRQSVLNIRADTRQPKIPAMKAESKSPISAIFTHLGYFAHFLYQKLGCAKYAKYYFSKCNLVLFMEVREMDNTACNTLLVTFYSGHVETS